MQILPAIDILDGKVVRLRQGRLDAVKVYNDDPVEQAEMLASEGAEWLHVVDLDGAVLGSPTNIEIIERIVRAVKVPVQTGGGIRSAETLDRLFDAGVSRAVLGTTLVTEPEFVAESCVKYPGIVAGIDARDGKVAIEGWKQGTEHGVLELVRELELLGVRRVAYTDIAHDGMQTGINYGAYRALVHQVDIPIIASGGVASLHDLEDLLSIGHQIEGVIIGTALYEGKFTLSQAIAAGRAREAR
ncbi:MAG: 1-(5-phosphoribosyl)-5-[(5-phosphoribosylamino)methylideneamino]imidazole-4-carboxamide isomerase [Coriobacteriia bacterium]|nr:1-(5-phosphoribosyl)-5-[(5-phosphoribosylamino)methylideneamino]imidazole-4-carboxamide isomerase [Coriobacteriia bacterium]